jgi:hypothetical protein
MFQRAEKDEIILDTIDYLISYFSICSENRNVLMHSRHDRSSETILSLVKKIKGKNRPYTLRPFKLSLPELQRVGDEIIAGTSYALDLWHHLYLRDNAMADPMRPLPVTQSSTLPPLQMAPGVTSGGWPTLETHERMQSPLPDKPTRPIALSPSQSTQG